jgi:hypothetical protein
MNTNPFQFGNDQGFDETREKEQEREDRAAAIYEAFETPGYIANPFAPLSESRMGRQIAVQPGMSAVPSAVTPVGYGDIGPGQYGSQDLADINSGISALRGLASTTNKFAEPDSMGESGYTDVSRHWQPLEAELMEERRARTAPSVLSPKSNWAPFQANPFAFSQGMPFSAPGLDRQMNQFLGPQPTGGY